MAQALEGLHVIDLAQQIAGPTTATYLADQGADVIKVEPLTGDHSRARSKDPVAGNSPGFMVLNRNKRAISVDLRQPDGKKILLQLVKRADVLVTNMRARASAKLGIGYDTLRELNPRLVYAHVTGFGSKGPYAEKGGYDRLTQGLSGVMARRGPEGMPLTAGILVSDPSVPMLLSYGIMLALWARVRTGLGQKVETSLLQAAVAMQAPHLIKVEDQTLDEGDPAAYGIFRCADAYINVCALTPGQLKRLCHALDLDHLAEDPRANDFSKRAEYRADAFPVIDGVLSTRPAKEWLAILDEADVPCAPILDRRQVFAEPQLLENGMLVSAEHPTAGTVQMFAPPFNLSDTPAKMRHLAPSLGQHTDDVLRELGYDEGAIQDLRSREIVR